MRLHASFGFALWFALAQLVISAPAPEEAHYKKAMAREEKTLQKLGAPSLQKPWAAFASALVNLRCSVQSGGSAASSDFLYWRAEMVDYCAEVLTGRTPFPNAAKEMRAALSRFQRLSKNVPPIGSEPTIPKDMRNIKQAMGDLETALKRHYAAEPQRAEAAIQSAQNLYAKLLTRLSDFIGED